MGSRMVNSKGNPLELAGNALKVGERAPGFSLLDKDGNSVSLHDFAGKPKLISVVPSLDTGLCDQQTRRFNEQAGRIPKAVVLTVSVDLPFAQKRWCGAAGLDHVITLSDHKETSFGRDYGVLIPELRLLARSVFVLDQNDSIVYLEYVPEISQHPDYDAALAALAKL